MIAMLDNRVSPDTDRRVLPATAEDLNTHLRVRGSLPALTGREVIAAAESAGLTGRGGAGFPTWRKLLAVASGGTGAVVVGNAAEGEPASAKDRTLLVQAPHLVLDGLALAARAVDAARVFLYVPESQAPAVRAALAARERAGVDRLPVTVRTAPRAFIAGEESAVVSALAGGPPVPRDTPDRVVRSGLDGRPTLVQNVETLAHLALIARYGPEWFRSAGTPEEPGTFLATLSGAVRRPGVYELPYGMRLRDLLRAAGGATGELQAVLIGGYHGGWAPARDDLSISRAGLAAYAATPGAGVVIPLRRDECGLAVGARIAAYLSEQSAKQCGPCLNGLPRLAGTLAAVARRERRPDLPSEVTRVARLVTGRGGCRHPDGTARFVASTMRAFATDVVAHLGGACLAEVAA